MGKQFKQVNREWMGEKSTGKTFTFTITREANTETTVRWDYTPIFKWLKAYISDNSNC